MYLIIWWVIAMLWFAVCTLGLGHLFGHQYFHLWLFVSFTSFAVFIGVLVVINESTTKPASKEGER